MKGQKKVYPKIVNQPVQSLLYLIDRTKSHAPIFWSCFLPDDKFRGFYFLFTMLVSVVELQVNFFKIPEGVMYFDCLNESAIISSNFCSLYEMFVNK